MSIILNNKVISGQETNIDNETIERNDLSSLSAIGMKTKSGEILTSWIGTKAEYDIAWENGSINENTLCIVTDIDEGEIGEGGGGSADLSGYYTKDEIDAMLGDINEILDEIIGE